MAATRDLLGMDSAGVPALMREGLSRCTRRWQVSRVARRSAGWSRPRRPSTAGAAARVYLADTLAVDVLTDTTERSPTFCTPSFRKWDDPGAAESWAFLFTPAGTTQDAWTRLLRRPPQTIEWNDDDLKELLDPEAALRQSQGAREIGLRELHRFRIGADGRGDRPPRTRAMARRPS